jgi:LmbE family N-acetylglucosaminyl deacetylase
MNKTVLAIFGHPDDAEQFCGGTLILLAKEGFEVWIAALTAGECGSHELAADEIVAIRAREAEEAAKKIGAKYKNLGIRDGCVSCDLETAKKVAALIREIDPLIIFTHPTVDYMTDHAHTGQLVFWAVPEARHANFPAPTKAPALEAQPYVYHTDPQGLTYGDRQIVRVNTVVDISEVIEEKLEAFATHESQIGFLEKRHKAAVEKTRRWAIIRGEQVRRGYGEGFYQELSAEYPGENILKEILGSKVITL